MTHNCGIFINYKRKSLLAANSWSYSSVVCLGPSFGIPSVFLWFSNEALTWICSIFEEGLVAP